MQVKKINLNNITIMEIEVNTIKEIYKGHSQVILNFPISKDLIDIIDLSYKYIWGFDHVEDPINWVEYTDSLFDKKCDNGTVKARNINLEYLIDTQSFIKLIPSMHQTVKLIQTNIVPPPYMDFGILRGG